MSAAAIGNAGGFSPSAGQARPFHERNPSAREFSAGILDPEEDDDDEDGTVIVAQPETGGEG